MSSALEIQLHGPAACVQMVFLSTIILLDQLRKVQNDGPKY
jgi:hypothetical protein